MNHGSKTTRIAFASALLALAAIGCRLGSGGPDTAAPGPSSPNQPPSNSPGPIDPPDAGTTSYTALAAAPGLDGGPIGSWFNSENAIFKDGPDGDLVGFFPGATTLLALVSRDSGRSWRTIEPSKPFMVPCGGTSSNTLCRDADGKVHILFGSNGYSGASYARLRLTRDVSGHVVDFESELPAARDGSGIPCIYMPEVNGNIDVRKALVAGYDAAGGKRLFFALYDNPNDGGFSGRIQAGASSAASGWSPSAESDWVSLSNSSGTSVLMRNSTPAGDPHNSGLHLAQHPRSRDLWFEWGPLNTGDTSTYNKNPVERLRAVPSGDHGWTPGTAEQVDVFSEANDYECLATAMAASSESVYFLRCSPDSGVVIDSADRYGRITRSAIPSPIQGKGLAGDLAFAVSSDGRQAWVGGWISYDSLTEPKKVLALHWDGTAWTRFDDVSLEDTAGTGQSTGWDGGLAFVIPRWEDPRHISLAAIRTE